MFVEALVGGILSAFFQLLFDRLSPRTNLFEFLNKYKFSESHLEKLELTLLEVNAVLSDAEEKQITNPFVRRWLDELKDAAYDTADLLDEINSLASAKPASKEEKRHFYKKIKSSKSRLEEMSSKLENIAKHKDVLGLKESCSAKPLPRFQSTSLVKESEVYGREDDKRKILKFLLSGDAYGNDIPVVAIIGMAGVGKTTLAQLLYNDSKVQSRFDFKAWVYVSQDLDVFKVTKTIYESVTFKQCDTTDLNMLQVKLKKKLVGKKFLFVLDDVWNENYCTWDVLRDFLGVGASESRIIMTTRNQGVASTMRAVHTCHLQPLNDKDCWFVFANHAFGSPHADDAPPKLESIGQKMMKKCGGLPLAAKVLGSLLYSKVAAHEWEHILNSNLWDLPNDKSNILPSLRLSYYNLPSHLKQCFAYCSMFPKHYVFDKEKLVLLWMAEGFVLQPKSDRTMEEVGIEYFNELLSRSFFQRANEHHNSHFIMHDLINELARFASSEFCFLFERGKSHDIPGKARHFSFVWGHSDDDSNLRNTLTRANCLRTFLPLKCSSSSALCGIDTTAVHDLVSKQKRLRVLSLSDFRNIHKLPDVFENLLHLRYLDFSYNTIRELPSSVAKLYNLQTLILSHCIQLIQLPADMKNLINLSHLDLKGAKSLKMMPPAFGELKSLQMLSNFVVSNTHGDSGLEELGKLLLLRGQLSILELQNVRDGKEAEKAKLKDKQNVKELEFKWQNNGSDDQETILENLCPHENLEKLSIVGYSGTRLPNWLGDSSISNMVILQLIDCRNCSCLPPLGHLSSLQELHVKNMPLLEVIGVHFYGQGTSSSIPFRSLRILKFQNMSSWKNWSPVTEGGFPLLEELHMQKCEHLIQMPSRLPSLVLLSVNECPQLHIDDIIGYPKLQDLRIRSCNYLNKITLNSSSQLKFLHIHDCRNLRFIKLSQDDLDSCQELEISECPNLELFSGRGLAARNLTSFSVYNCSNLRSMPKQMHTLLHSLQSLIISDCPRLVSFPDGGLPQSLQALTIQNCVKLRSMPGQMHTLLHSLQSLIISDCPRLVSFPDGGLPPSLQTLTIQNCVKLGSMPELMHMILSSLQTLDISGCPELESFPDGGLPQSLQALTIRNCVKLRSMPEQMHMLLSSLQTLDISSCPELVSFPDGGLPPSLQTLTIQNCVNLTPQNAWGLRNMTSLTCLTIECAYANVTSFPDEDLLPESLTFLQISEFPVLEKLNLSGLQHLSLLKHLQINCSRLQTLSDGMLPNSLCSLSISGCSSLTERCQNEYWDKISHVPHKVINDYAM